MQHLVLHIKRIDSCILWYYFDMKTSRGFISLGLILLIVISLAVLGGAGYWATKQSPTQQQAENDTTSKTIDTSKSTQVQVQTTEDTVTITEDSTQTGAFTGYYEAVEKEA